MSRWEVLVCACALAGVCIHSAWAEKNKTDETTPAADKARVAASSDDAAADDEMPAEEADGSGDESNPFGLGGESADAGEKPAEMPERESASPQSIVAESRKRQRPYIDPARQAIVVARPEEVAGSEKLERALDEQTMFDFTEVPLSDVVDYLRDLHEIEIQLDLKALEDESIGPDTPLTRRLERISLRSALHHLLGALDLAFVIRDEVLVITTREEADRTLVVKIYPVGDLALPLSDNKPKPGGEFQSLIEVIRATLPYKAPRDGQPRRMVAVVPQTKSLVVVQTDEAHQRVADLLAGLRKAREVQGKR